MECDNMDDDLELQEIRKRKAEQLMMVLNKEQEKKEWPGEVIHIGDHELDGIINKYDTVLVDFWAPWCGPCKMIGPILDQLASEYKGKVVFAKLNVDQSQATASRFKVQGIPTMIFFKSGRPVDRITGALPRASLKALIDKYIDA